METTRTNTPKHEWESMQEYSELLMDVLETSWWDLWRKLKAITKAEQFREDHVDCCNWPSEEE